MIVLFSEKEIPQNQKEDGNFAPMWQNQYLLASPSHVISSRGPVYVSERQVRKNNGT